MMVVVPPPPDCATTWTVSRTIPVACPGAVRIATRTVSVMSVVPPGPGLTWMSVCTATLTSVGTELEAHPNQRAPDGRDGGRRRDREVRSACARQRDRGLRHVRGDLADGEMEEGDPALPLRVRRELDDAEPAVLGEEERAVVGQ